ncbi:flavin reductase family protein [Nocardiopsis dassonvillei]|uniref:flavin reductase family protein n=1 Tax=Nocardiopsis dassonvillei TaxID=2014 RepID=UPI00363C1861
MSTAQSASPPHPASEAARFRETLRHHPAGVVVVTAGVGGRPVGLTATSFTSVSLDPPLVAFYVAETSSTWTTLHLAGAFAVHLLAQDQTDLAARFAHRGADRFAPPTSWRPGPEEVPLLDGVSASLVCRRFDTRLIGDHWLVVGEVTHTLVLDDLRPPLLYHRGAFGGFVPLHGPDPA